MSQVDLTPLIQALASLLVAVLVAAVPIALRAFLALVHLRLTDSQIAAVKDAAQQGANVAYGVLVEQGASVGRMDVRNAAVAIGVNHVLASVPDALAAAGITPAHVSEMVTARFGGLLAADPSVSLKPAPVAVP
jgi:hypothetical protein